ncbi:hypothetical protein AB1N83_009083 [Pleurotus pulmonarius]
MNSCVIPSEKIVLFLPNPNNRSIDVPKWLQYSTPRLTLNVEAFLVIAAAYGLVIKSRRPQGHRNQSNYQDLAAPDLDFKTLVIYHQ